MPAKIKFTLRGRMFEKDKEDFLKGVSSVKPGRIQKYSTVINGERYPIRQVVASITNLPSIAITSQDAYRILEKFGFSVDTDQ